MMGVWFPQEQLGRASTIIEMGPVLGNFFALLVAPPIARYLGWRSCFWAVGGITACFMVIWQRQAVSTPQEVSTQMAELGVAGVAEETEALHDSPIKDAAAKAPARPRGASGAVLPMLPSLCWLSPAVWCVVIQHCIFNGTKYFFASFMLIYYQQTYKLEPHDSGLLLTLPELLGVVAPFGVSQLERYLMNSPPRGMGITLLQSRRFFGVTGFGGICFPLAAMALGAGSAMHMTALPCELLLSRRPLPWL